MKHLSLHQIQEQIQQADSFDHLRSIRDQVHEKFHEYLLLSHSMEAHQLLNAIHDELIKRTIYLSEKQLEQSGLRKPPVKYAFILFGSGGRSEQTLWSDQDNGFIFEDCADADRESVEEYFGQLVRRILQGLEQLGYPPCQGNVISSNLQWRKPVSEWLQMMLEWLEEPIWEHVRYLLIMVDLRCIYGESSLVFSLQNEFHDYVRDHPMILQSMLSNTLHHKVSLGVFGHLITERYGEDAGGIDIKYGAYIPIVNGIRLLAIKAGIRCSSTLERIQMLIEGNHVEKDLADQWLQALSIVLNLRASTPFQIEDQMYTTRGKLSQDQLTKECRNDLKFCLKTGIYLQKYVKKVIETSC